MLLCDTGKCLDIDEINVDVKPAFGSQLLAWEPGRTFRDKQMFCPWKIVCPMTKKEYCLIGRLAEKAVPGDRLFLTVPEEVSDLQVSGPAYLGTIAHSDLFGLDMTNTLKKCW